jgi:hypothetical protein
MNKVDQVADEILRDLKAQSGIDLERDHALIIAHIRISALEGVHVDRVRRACARWHRFKSEYQARGKEWLHGTGDLPDLPTSRRQLMSAGHWEGRFSQGPQIWRASLRRTISPRQ